MFRRGCKTPVNRFNQSCWDSRSRPCFSCQTSPLEQSNPPSWSEHWLSDSFPSAARTDQRDLITCWFVTRHLPIMYAPPTRRQKYNGMDRVFQGVIICGKGRQSKLSPFFPASDQGEIINYPPCLATNEQSYELSHLTATLFWQLNWLNKTMVRTIRAKKKRQ